MCIFMHDTYKHIESGKPNNLCRNVLCMYIVCVCVYVYIVCMDVYANCRLNKIN